MTLLVLYIDPGSSGNFTVCYLIPLITLDYQNGTPCMSLSQPSSYKFRGRDESGSKYDQVSLQIMQLTTI